MTIHYQLLLARFELKLVHDAIVQERKQHDPIPPHLRRIETKLRRALKAANEDHADRKRQSSRRSYSRRKQAGLSPG